MKTLTFEAALLEILNTPGAPKPRSASQEPAQYLKETLNELKPLSDASDDLAADMKVNAAIAYQVALVTREIILTANPGMKFPEVLPTMEQMGLAYLNQEGPNWQKSAQKAAGQATGQLYALTHITGPNLITAEQLHVMCGTLCALTILLIQANTL